MVNAILRNRPSIGMAGVHSDVAPEKCTIPLFCGSSSNYGDDANWDLVERKSKIFPNRNMASTGYKITLNTVTNEGHGEKDGKIKAGLMES